MAAVVELQAARAVIQYRVHQNLCSKRYFTTIAGQQARAAANPPPALVPVIATPRGIDRG